MSLILTSALHGGVPGNFKVTYSFCPHSVALGYTHPLTERNIKEFSLGCKVRPAHRADNSAVLVVPNVKARTQAQNSTPPLSVHDLLRGSFTFYCMQVRGKLQHPPATS